MRNDQRAAQSRNVAETAKIMISKIRNTLNRIIVVAVRSASSGSV